ncbi:putative membrane protein YgcG [Chromobacterium alkanivorans]|uniref:hypothetical protein n=1 Tax=Chromobacterium TaxID=535 RepID=UPI000A5FCF04|nr:MULTISPECIES: hypothetical protein [Chromobacterium]MBN3004820.1 hypothetical protein [Chromobacterium alkanivorans]MCS3803118.1 putative membrane protein YgcG [Chromobacterium alkanivorans]MCS3817772.1 putative membrane protein YgcG [Chromobacterium alkanivorans]MCS3872484.1 putative membrane protein YgcG [Chromobacterium alkanivorans]
MSPGLYKAFCLLVIVITTMINFSNMDSSSRGTGSRSWSSGSGGGSSGWGSGGGGHK